MNITVCIKQVPDTAEVKLDPKTGTLIRDGVPSIINPDDKSGLEAALRLKDSAGAEVTVLCMGPPQAELALREALAMGADRAILLTDRAFAGSDTLATSTILAAALKKISPDLIIAGRQAIDGDTAQVGPQIAAHLGLPLVSYVEEIEKKDDKLIVRRNFEDGYQRLEIGLPCLLTVLKELNAPRYMNVAGIYDVYREAPIERWSKDGLDIDETAIGLAGSPTKVQKSFTKGARTAGQLFEGTTEESVRRILDSLRERYVI